MTQRPVVQMKGISKYFPGVKALDDVSVDIYPGEVHVLIGENGAGKSTLSKILMGIYTASSGEILVDGQQVNISSPSVARAHGIGGVHQEFMLVPWLNVAQNIFLNREPRWKNTFLIDHSAMHRQSRELLSSLGVDIDTRLPIRRLGTAQQQMVEIAKALEQKLRVFILDEPTAVLSAREVELLFKQVRRMKEEGVAIVYISHRLQEIREIGDRVTVLRDGKHVTTCPLSEVTDDELVRLMVGRNISLMYPRHRREPGAEVLAVSNLCVKNGPQNINLKVHSGEIVGIAGLVGSGRTELARAVFGIDPIEKGEVRLYGQPVKPQSPNQMVKRGMGLLPEDRKQYGLALRNSVAQNTVMASLRQRFPKGIISERKIHELAGTYVEKLHIATPHVRRTVGYLSGGNQQKVVLAKWLDTESGFLIFDEPTRGIDVGAKVEVHTLMDQLVQQGTGILMISSDLPEVLGMSDRIYVMYEGRIVGHFTHEKATQEKVASLMLGVGVKGNGRAQRTAG